MSGATVGILGYTKGICMGTTSPLLTSMFTIRGSGLAPRVCQPATTYELNAKQNRNNVIPTVIRPLPHGISLPHISWQQSHRNIQLSASNSRKNSAILDNMSPHSSLIESDYKIQASSFSNFRVLETDKTACGSKLKDDKKADKPSPVQSYTSLYYEHLFDEVDNRTLNFDTKTGCTTSKDSNQVKLTSRSAKYSSKKKPKSRKTNGRKSRCTTRKDVSKKGKLKIQNNQVVISSYNALSKNSVLQIEAVPKQTKTRRELSEDGASISRTSSTTKSISSSETSLCSDVFQRASTIYTKAPVLEGDEKVRRVYLSDKQSGVIKDCGMMLPCAPPCTPTIEQLKKVEYVLSMNDIRSQRTVKERLSQIESKARRKELAKKEEAKRTEKQYLKEKELQKKQRQRLEIYALNKIMTELEENNFKKFCEIMENNLDNSEKSSTNKQT
ncbi:uncharacterized protein [Antedon mediterranea]|uniref:uncharacterized protein n=1 Tax=Antedon mediterranea TaxID=105859 RepID=UPI003AF709A3